MLMTVLRGELAIKQSRALVRTFKKMKDYILANDMLPANREMLKLSMQVSDANKSIIEIKHNLSVVEDNMATVMGELSDVVRKSELADIYSRAGIFHDRYIILDYGTDKEKVYLCGSSSKDSGARTTTILEDSDTVNIKI